MEQRNLVVILCSVCFLWHSSTTIVVDSFRITTVTTTTASTTGITTSTAGTTNADRTTNVFGLRQHSSQNGPLMVVQPNRMTDATTVVSNDNDINTIREKVKTRNNQPQLLPHTFAGMVERQLLERFGTENDLTHHSINNSNNDDDTPSIERVLQSWRLLEQDYIHKEYIGNHNSSNGMDSSMAHSYSYQLCHSYVPGLTVRQFWNVSSFDWCQQLASQYPTIRNEFLSVTADLDHLRQHGNNLWATALDANVAQQYGSGWSTLVLMNRGIWDAENVQLFPQTSQILYDCNVPAVEIFFASMQPNSSIPYHSDYTNFVLTSHLGIDIPNSGTNQCRLNVGGTAEEQWLNGKVMIFDTSIMHNAINENTEQVRYILMMRIWHPDLTPVERQALQYIYDTLEFPELITTMTNTDARRQVEHEIQLAKTFPLLSSSSTSSSSLSQPSDSKRSSNAGGFGATLTTSGATKKKNKKKTGR